MQFRKLTFSEVVIHPLTVVGPWTADLTARAFVSAHTSKSDSLLSQSTVSGGYMDFHVKPSYCRLQQIQGAKSSETNRPSGMASNLVSTFNADAPKDNGDGEYSWSRWHEQWDTIHANCPFRKCPHYMFAGENVKFLAVTVSYNKREGKGLAEWGSFSGIIPVSSMPSWIKIPGGDNRWRLWDEQLEYSNDNDGARILRVRRVLLGIPDIFVDMNGDRCQWNQTVIGQKNWDDIV